MLKLEEVMIEVKIMAKNKSKTSNLQFKYRGLVLDTFQQEAIWHIQNNTSLLVSAPTGTGKTLIADYLIDTSLKAAVKTIYTAPIKALVNQKYADFLRQFGKNSVGIATGDITIRPDAPLLVMTTEIFRNMLLRKDTRIDTTKWVIFDELHYLNHQERGTVWEESILLKPASTHLLGLSATVPNIEEIAHWITSIRQESVAVVKHDTRAVPLKHLYFNQACQAIERNKLMESFAQATLHHDDAYDFKGGNLTTQDIHLPKQVRYRDSTRFLDLVRYTRKERLFPVLYFSFSRNGCEEKAKSLATHQNYLSDKEQQGVLVNVRKRLRELELTKEDIPHFERDLDQWTKGIGVHHAGLLPVVKQLAETLLAQGLIRVLFTTETFAVGVNMPVRTVCFDTLVKYDGNQYRYLTHQEYFQMAGRAGRRGKDRQGVVLSLVDFAALSKNPIPQWSEEHLEPIQSQFNLTYNIVLNLYARHSEGEIHQLLAKTLAGYQNPDNIKQITSDYERKKDILTRLGFIENGVLTDKGELGRHIYIQELLLTELLYSNSISNLKPKQLAGMAASLIDDYTLKLPAMPPEKWLIDIQVVAEQINRRAEVNHTLTNKPDAAAANLIMQWTTGLHLEDLLKQIPVAPGDFVQLCRRSIDILRQLQSLTTSSLATKTTQAIEQVDRGVVQVRF